MFEQEELDEIIAAAKMDRYEPNSELVLELIAEIDTATARAEAAEANAKRLTAELLSIRRQVGDCLAKLRRMRM